jgi:arrestin (S-antigen)-like protein
MGIFEDLFSTHQHSIFIHTTKPDYYPGELVQGTVHLNLTAPTDIDAITLLVEGKVKAHFTRSESYSYSSNGKTERGTRTKVYEEKQVFYTRVTSLLITKSTLQPGVFVFPFQFHLDYNLPGTCHITHGNSEGKVHYSLFAQAIVPGFFKSNLEHTQELRVAQPQREMAIATQTFKEENVTFLCCISKGHVSLSANLVKNLYYPNEMVEVKLQINNSESKVNLRACSLQLIQHVVLHAKGAEETFSVKVAETKSPPIAAGETCDRTIQMLLPFTLESSTDARIVKCIYQLVVRLSVPWSPDVVLVQPVQILNAPLSSYVPAIPYIPNQIMMPEVVMPPPPMMPQKC